MEARVPATPLTIVWKRLFVDEATLLVIREVVAIEPPRFEVRVLEDTESVLEVTRLVIVAFVVVELETTRLVMLARVATRFAKNALVEVALVAITLGATRLLDTVRLVVEAFVRVVCPVTVNEVKSEETAESSPEGVRERRL